MHLPNLHKLTSRTPKLKIDLNQSFELPGISRFHTPHPNQLFTPTFKENLLHVAKTDLPQVINLEKVQEIEEKLWEILENLKKDEEVASICAEF